MIRFCKRRKFSPRYIVPFEILERVGPVAYYIKLPPNLSGVHHVFMYIRLIDVTVMVTISLGRTQ